LKKNNSCRVESGRAAKVLPGDSRFLANVAKFGAHLIGKMKTEKLVLLIIFLLFSVAEVSAQTYYYTQNKTLSGQDVNSSNTYTYQCIVDNSTSMVRLYNAANQKTNAEQTFKNGSPLTQSFLLGEEKLFEKDNWTWNKCQSIVNNAFSADEKQRVKGNEFVIEMIIDSDTGKVTEVEFNFLHYLGFGTIPLSVYRKIELELKSNVWFTVTDVGKSLNFVSRGWSQEVK